MDSIKKLNGLFREYYLCLSEEKYMVNGAKRSIIMDFKNDCYSYADTNVREIVDLGEKGLNISEIIETLKSKIKASDVILLISKLQKEGIVHLSSKKGYTLHSNPIQPRLNHLWLEISSSCNLHCIHCYAESMRQSKNELSQSDIIQVINEASKLGCRNIQFTGGECTLRDDLIDLLMHAKLAKFLCIEVFTNGTLLNKKTVEFFAREKINVAISLYSYRAETHDAITGVPGSFAKTLKGLELLMSLGVRTRCSIPVMKENMDDIKGVCHFLSVLGIPFRTPDIIKPVGRGQKLEPWLDEDMLRNPVFLFDGEMCKRNQKWNSCWYGKAAITCSGYVLPCVFARNLTIGNVRTQSLREIIFGEEMQSLWALSKDKVRICKDCEYRYICEDCRPEAFGFTGDLYAKSPRCAYNPYSESNTLNIGVTPPSRQ